jgi:hypothetical protein
MLRARVFATRRSLDDLLADGANPAQTAALALRARQLVSPRARQQVATGLERLVWEAQRPAPLHPAALLLARRQIVELRAALLGIVECLRTARPVYAQGMALAVAAADRWRRARLRPARHAFSLPRGARGGRRARRAMGGSLLGLAAVTRRR